MGILGRTPEMGILEMGTPELGSDLFLMFRSLESKKV